MSEPIRFYARGQLCQITDAAPTRTLLQTLREDLHCTGTKEACAEGDCGACTVVLADLVDGQIRTRAINACIQFIPSLDGKALITVEDLQQSDGSLHPVQQSLVDHHASQCGFCTPGFVMSLWAMYLSMAQSQHAMPSPPSREQINTALSGNLCRCTGYRPIIDAALHMFDYPAPAHSPLPTLAQLQALQRTQGWHYQGTDQHGAAHDCFIPHSEAELAALRQAHPQALLLAGGTDMGLWVTKQLRQLPPLIYLAHIASLHQMNEVDDWLEIGAMVSLNDAYQRLSQHYPQQLTEFWQRFASHPIRNIGTLGGNLANGSPIGDSMPFLIALGAQLVLHSARGERSMALEDFYLAYQKKDLASDEWVASVRVPLPALRHEWQWRTYKLSKRFDQDISAVCAGFALHLQNGVITQARLAFGGMAATSRRASQCEAALLGKNWATLELAAAQAALAQDFQALSDMRASSGYRLKSAQQLLQRFWLETQTIGPGHRHVPATNVFASSASTMIPIAQVQP
ncbi:MAG: xanthine dehydrogenase small subunit [Pseudomonadota bacterium]